MTPHEPTQRVKTFNSPGISGSQPNKVTDLTKPQLDAIFGASNEELSEVSDLEVASKRTKLIEARNEKCAESIHVASPLSIPEKGKRVAKTGPSSRTRDNAELPGISDVIQEANDRQDTGTSLAPRSSHHPVSPTKSTSNARPDCKYGRKVRITSMESDAGERVPPYVEAASTATTGDAGTVASVSIVSLAVLRCFTHYLGVSCTR